AHMSQQWTGICCARAGVSVQFEENESANPAEGGFRPAESRFSGIQLAPCGHDATVPPQLPKSGHPAWVPRQLAAIFAAPMAESGEKVAMCRAIWLVAGPAR